MYFREPVIRNCCRQGQIHERISLKYELSLKGKFEIWDEGESGSLERRKKKTVVTNLEFADLFYNNPEKENWNDSLCSGFLKVAQVVKDPLCSAGDPV